jgi:hypothetical protein
MGYWQKGDEVSLMFEVRENVCQKVRYKLMRQMGPGGVKRREISDIDFIMWLLGDVVSYDSLVN